MDAQSAALVAVADVVEHLAVREESGRYGQSRAIASAIAAVLYVRLDDAVGGQASRHVEADARIRRGVLAKSRPVGIRPHAVQRTLVHVDAAAVQALRAALRHREPAHPGPGMIEIHAATAGLDTVHALDKRTLQRRLVHAGADDAHGIRQPQGVRQLIVAFRDNHGASRRAKRPQRCDRSVHGRVGCRRRAAALAVFSRCRDINDPLVSVTEFSRQRERLLHVVESRHRIEPRDISDPAEEPHPLALRRRHRRRLTGPHPLLGRFDRTASFRRRRHLVFDSPLPNETHSLVISIGVAADERLLALFLAAAQKFARGQIAELPSRTDSARGSGIVEHLRRHGAGKDVLLSVLRFGYPPVGRRDLAVARTIRRH